MEGLVEQRIQFTFSHEVDMTGTYEMAYAVLNIYEPKVEDIEG